MDITLCPKCCVRVLPTSESRGPGYQSDLTHAGIVVMDAFSQPSAPSTEPSEVNRQSTGGNCCRMPTGQRLRLALKRFVIFELILIGVPGLLAVLFLLSIALRLALLLLGIIQLGLMTLVLPARRLCPWGFADDFLGVLPQRRPGVVCTLWRLHGTCHPPGMVHGWKKKTSTARRHDRLCRRTLKETP